MQWLLYLSLCGSLLFFPIQKEEISIEKEEVLGSYCVMSMKDNRILKNSRPEYTQSVASISKIMTAIIVIEEGNLDDTIIINDQIDFVEGSSLYLQKGDQYSILDLLYGLLLRSGNDAAILLATHVGGEVDHFVEMMNRKANDIGMKQSIFHNPSGLDEEDGGNISSSCDMALLMSYAMQNDTFRKITGTKEYRCSNGKYMKNKNRFLNHYLYATGGKTGYTKKAKRTLVTTSKKENTEIVVVTLNAFDDFHLHELLHEDAYEKYETVTLINKGNYLIDHHIYHIPSDLTLTIKKQDHDAIFLYFDKQKKKIHVKVQYHRLEKEYVYE